MTALAQLIRGRMRDLDIVSFDQAALQTRPHDTQKGVGLNSDTIRRLANGDRTAMHERTLNLLAPVLRVPVADLRAASMDRSRVEVDEFRVPPEAHHVLMTPRVHRAVQELIRSVAEALDAAYEEGHQDAAPPSPLDVAEALGSVESSV